MVDAQRYRSLSPWNRALVAVAVLLDGREAAVYLESDALNGAGLEKAAGDLASQDPELRMPYVGTVLRHALREVEAQGR